MPFRFGRVIQYFLAKLFLCDRIARPQTQGRTQVPSLRGCKMRKRYVHFLTLFYTIQNLLAIYISISYCTLNKFARIKKRNNCNTCDQITYFIHIKKKQVQKVLKSIRLILAKTILFLGFITSGSATAQTPLF